MKVNIRSYFAEDIFQFSSCVTKGSSKIRTVFYEAIRRRRFWLPAAKPFPERSTLGERED